MQILVISSSLDPQSRSERLAQNCLNYLLQRKCDVAYVTLKEHRLEGFDNRGFIQSPTYKFLHAAVLKADGIVLASPVYNWGCCAEVKKFVEHIGSTSPDGSIKGAFYDKVISFVNSAGLPHSYMAFTGLANSMMLDFKCIINPYNVYVYNQHWHGEDLIETSKARLKKSMDVMLELTALLKERNYQSAWEI